MTEQTKMLPMLKERIQEIVADRDGVWRTCSGCYETSDGQNVHGYPYSDIFGCTLGSGCRECGGVGAVWDTTDYDEMGRELSRAPDPEAAKLIELFAEQTLLVDRLCSAVDQATEDVGHESIDSLLKLIGPQNERCIEMLGGRAALTLTRRVDGL